jgi:hypothetical protein
MLRRRHNKRYLYLLVRKLGFKVMINGGLVFCHRPCRGTVYNQKSLDLVDLFALGAIGSVEMTNTASVVGLSIAQPVLLHPARNAGRLDAMILQSLVTNSLRVVQFVVQYLAPRIARPVGCRNPPNKKKGDMLEKHH